MPIIRPALIKDAAALASFAEKSFLDPFEKSNIPEDMNLYCESSFGPDLQTAEIANTALTTLLCMNDCDLLGFAQLRRGNAPSFLPSANSTELKRLCVDAQWHGKGVAKQLMDATIASAVGESANGLWLAVWEHNPRAIAFYEKYGFAAVGEQSFLLGNDQQRDIGMFREVP